VDVDGDGSLGGLLAYLDAEEEHGEGLQQAVPSADDSVKLMTVHRAKGLEWDTVYLPSLVDKVFPSESRTGAWPTKADTLPAPLRGDASSIPQLAEHTKDGIAAYREALKDEHRLAEDRLAYVAATRAKRLLIASSHIWTPGNVRPRRESPYFTVIREAAERLGSFLDAATRGQDRNPVPAEPARADWPVALNPEALAARREAAALVREAGEQTDPETWAWRSGTVAEEDAARVASWDDSAAHLARLLTRRRDQSVELPEGLSATALMTLSRAPEELAGTLLRRMPRRPSPQARLGIRFHAWLQDRFELPSALDEFGPAEGPVDAEFARLVAAFEAGRFAALSPIGVEVPFVMRRSGVVLRGRIDAVYDWRQGGFAYLVVDWKTSNAAADALQLAVYRQAWAEARGVDPSLVAAGFYHVQADRLRLVDAPARLIDEAISFGVRQ
jgi:DNA helicase-2/ATP-dependent DNA helicase PcrA